ncbi:hypothetical protein RSAG8_05188, partial [Rhizoctonia solani AG-8 WAC10335]
MARRQLPIAYRGTLAHEVLADHGDVGGLMIPGAGHALPMLFAAVAVVLAHSLFGSLFGEFTDSHGPDQVRPRSRSRPLKLQNKDARGPGQERSRSRSRTPTVQMQFTLPGKYSQ